jgi:hypothetical protein
MLHVNEDNDGIFRRAAEAYPLDTGHGNWEAMRKKLAHQDEEEEMIAIPLRRNYLPLIIFAIIGLGLPFLTRDLFQTGLHSAFIQKNNAVALPGEATNTGTLLTQDRILESDKTDPSNDPVLPVLPANHILQVNKASTVFPGSNVVNTLHEIPLNPEHSSEKIAVTTEHDNTSALAPEQTGKNDKQITTGNTVAVNGEKQQKRKTKRIYAGLLGGADISMIKLQGANKIGHSYGIRLGYTLSRRIAIESGIQSDKKYYKTSGEYFNTKNIRLPQYAEILSASGNCDMYEVPLQVRYSFKQKKKTGISVFAGASAYMMKKEDYTYQVKRNNYVYPRQVSYKNADTRLIAAINTGLTIHIKLGKSAIIIGEPVIIVRVSDRG